MLVRLHSSDMSASATAPYPCGEYPVALLDLPATVKKELVAYRAARDRNENAASLTAIERAFAAADIAGCRTRPHFAAVLVEGGECEMTDAKGQLQYCTEALALLQAAPSLPPILRSVHSRALVSRSQVLRITGRHTEAIADAQQAAALAVTPWDEVHAYDRLVALLGEMPDKQGRRHQHEAAVRLEAAVAACEAAGVPHTDKVLQNGTETLWTIKYQRAGLMQDHATELFYVRKLRALSQQEGHRLRNHPIHMLGEEAGVLARLGRVEEAMALLVPAAQLVNELRSSTCQGYFLLIHSILYCVNACVLARQPALARSFLSTAEGMATRLRAALMKHTDAHGMYMMQQSEGMLAKMKARIAQLDGDTAGAAAHQRSSDELKRQEQRMCSAEGCTHSFQANGEKLLMCSACKKACYCSAVCQKADWKARHKAACASKA